MFDLHSVTIIKGYATSVRIFSSWATFVIDIKFIRAYVQGTCDTFYYVKNQDTDILK